MMHLGDPLLTDDHIDVLGIATKEEANEIKEKAFKVNEVLTSFLQNVDIRLD